MHIILQPECCWKNILDTSEAIWGDIESSGLIATAPISWTRQEDKTDKHGS